MMIGVKTSGSDSKVRGFLNRMLHNDLYSDLNRYGRMGVDALASSTPTRTGETAAAWDYKIDSSGKGVSIHWVNNNDEYGMNVAVLIQYGHGTGTGGYVEGIDYINPAIRPIFEQIAENIWKKVTS